MQSHPGEDERHTLLSPPSPSSFSSSSARPSPWHQSLLHEANRPDWDDDYETLQDDPASSTSPDTRNFAVSISRKPGPGTPSSPWWWMPLTLRWLRRRLYGAPWWTMGEREERADLGRERMRTRGPWCVPLLRSRGVRTRWVWITLAAFACSIALIVALLLRFRVGPVYAPASDVIDLGYASYRGVLVGSGESVAQYLGMRYAAPPLGERRWRAPVVPDAIHGVQQAIWWGRVCLGTDHGYPFGYEDEDCLFANVWAPAAATNQSSLPVWVYIQGGGYTSNANADINGKGVVEASNGTIVVVSFNYRVGLLGFMASEEVRRYGDLNVGLLDQRFLLQWVRRHISQFGGNPDHVVIHGMSAGSGSVAMHLAAYGGRDDKLFVGAVADSVFFPAQPPLADLEYQYERVLNQTGCRSVADDHMACLRGMDIAALQAANRAQPFPGRTGNPIFYWTPCVDGDFIHDYPHNLYEAGKFLQVPMIFGTTTDEGTVFARDARTQAEVAEFLQDNYPTLANASIGPILSHYPLLPALPHHNDWFPSAALAYGEATFVCPNAMILDAFLSARNSTAAAAGKDANATAAPRAWGYRYNVVDGPHVEFGLGVSHGSQDAAVFGPGNSPTPESYLTYNAPAVALTMGYYISFVRTLDPNTLRIPGAPLWGEWRADNRQRLVIQAADPHMEELDGEEVARCATWMGASEVARQ